MDAKLITKSKITQFIENVLPLNTSGNFYNVMNVIHREGLFETLDPLMNLIQNNMYEFYFSRGRNNSTYRLLYEKHLDNSINNSNSTFRVFLNVISQRDMGLPTLKQHMKEELDRRTGSDFRTWVGKEVTDISKLFQVPGYAEDQLQALYCEKAKTILIAITMRESYDVVDPRVIEVVYPLLIQLQTVLASVYPVEEYFPAAIAPALEKAYDLAKTSNKLYQNPADIALLKDILSSAHLVCPTLSDNPLAKYLKEETEKQNELEKLLRQQKISNIEGQYADLLAKLDRLSSERYAIQLEEIQPFIDETDYTSITDSLNSFEELQLISFESTGNGYPCLTFHVIGNMALDPDLVKTNFINNKEYYKFYKGIIDKKFKCLIGYSIIVPMIPNRDSSIGYKEFPYATDLQFTPNHHLRDFGCMGSNKDAIARARNAKNWVVVALQCILTATQLNLADNAVRGSFENKYLRRSSDAKILPILLPDGTYTTWHEYNKQETEELL